MNRFYYPNKIGTKLAEKEIVNQLIRVFRAGPGYQFVLFNENKESIVKIEKVNKGELTIKILEEYECQKDLDKNITLYQSLIKKDKFEWVVQKAAELGIRKITPIITENSVVKDFSSNKAARYQKIIKEATEQCGGCKLAELSEPLKFLQGIENINKKDLSLIAHEKIGRFNLLEILEANKSKNINIFIGPEGGFSEMEIEFAIRQGIKPISLGKRVLRSETAAIAACSLLTNLN